MNESDTLQDAEPTTDDLRRAGHPKDVTGKLFHWAADRIEELEAMDIRPEDIGMIEVGINSPHNYTVFDMKDLGRTPIKYGIPLWRFSDD